MPVGFAEGIIGATAKLSEPVSANEFLELLARDLIKDVLVTE